MRWPEHASREQGNHLFVALSASASIDGAGPFVSNVFQKIVSYFLLILDVSQNILSSFFPGNNVWDATVDSTFRVTAEVL